MQSLAPYTKLFYIQNPTFQQSIVLQLNKDKERTESERRKHLLANQNENDRSREKKVQKLMRKVLEKDRLYKESRKNDILLDLQELQNMFENNNNSNDSNNNEMIDEEENMSDEENKVNEEESQFKWDATKPVSDELMKELIEIHKDSKSCAENLRYNERICLLQRFALLRMKQNNQTYFDSDGIEWDVNEIQSNDIDISNEQCDIADLIGLPTNEIAAQLEKEEIKTVSSESLKGEKGTLQSHWELYNEVLRRMIDEYRNVREKQSYTTRVNFYIGQYLKFDSSQYPILVRELQGNPMSDHEIDEMRDCQAAAGYNTYGLCFQWIGAAEMKKILKITKYNLWERIIGRKLIPCFEKHGPPIEKTLRAVISDAKILSGCATESLAENEKKSKKKK